MKFLAQSGLEAFLGFLAGSARVVAPVKTDGVVQYQVWAPGTEVELDVLLAKQSPKEYVFPQSETCLSFLYTMACPAVKPMSTEEARAELEEGEGGEVIAPPTSVSHELLLRGRLCGRKCSGHLRPASLRRTRLRPDGPSLRRVRRLLLRPLLQRPPRRHHARGRDLPRPALHLLLLRHRG